VNFFSTVNDLREFITAAQPAPDVNITIKMCCLTSERLSGDNGTRVTLIDAGQRGLFEATYEGLMELTSGKRKPYIAQVTVWDAKGKKGYASKANMLFRPGSLYEFRQVDGVVFCADIPSGRVQYDRDATDKISELLPPPNKRKSPRESPAKKKGKNKPREVSMNIDGEGAIDVDVTGFSNEADPAAESGPGPDAQQRFSARLVVQLDWSKERVCMMQCAW
jgi:hypothetical protein